MSTKKSKRLKPQRKPVEHPIVHVRAGHNTARSRCYALIPTVSGSRRGAKKAFGGVLCREHQRAHNSGELFKEVDRG